jgi:hypothetical protein
MIRPFQLLIQFTYYEHAIVTQMCKDGMCLHYE